MAHKKIFLIIILLFLPFLLFGQIERWVYTYNGAGNYDDRAHSIVYGTDGNLYVGGEIVTSGSPSNPNWDFAVTSLTSTGTERWVYTYDGLANDVDAAKSIVYGADGNIYAAGHTNEDIERWNITVVSLTPNGDERWMYQYNGPGARPYEKANCMVCGADGDLYVAGTSIGADPMEDNDIVVIGLTSNGNETWVYRYDGPGNFDDEAWSIIYGEDGNLYIAGYSAGIGSSGDFTVISLATNGTERWVYCYDGPAHSVDYAWDIAYGLDGNLYVAGFCEWPDFGPEFTVLSLTRFGAFRWIYRYFAYAGYYAETATSIAYGLDGNVYVTGFASGEQLDDFTVISLTSSGALRWDYQYNGSGWWYDQANKIIYGSDGNLYVAGDVTETYPAPDFGVISLTTNGAERWVYTYDGIGNNADRAYDVVYGLDGNIYAVGLSTGNGTYEDFTVISLNSIIGVEEFSSNPSSESQPEILSYFFNEEISIKFANPIAPPLKIILYDALGRSVYKTLISTTISNSLILNDKSISDLPRGIYFLNITQDKKTYQSTKLIKP